MSLGGLLVLISVTFSTGCTGDCLECYTSPSDSPCNYYDPDFVTAELTCTFEYGGTFVEEVTCGGDEVGLEEWPSGWPGSGDFWEELDDPERKVYVRSGNSLSKTIVVQ